MKTSPRGARSISISISISVFVAASTLAGCASATQAGGATSPSTPTPTAACPSQEGVELPPECAPYDPEDAMAANDRYRERIELDAQTDDTNAAVAGTVQDILEELRVNGDVGVDSVANALETTGLDSVQVRDDHGRILFGAGAPAGGCVYGEVAEAGVRVDVGGYILDGGCLPAQ